MKLKLILLGISALAASSAFAQDIEGGIFLGTAQYQGDLSEKHITLPETKPSFGIIGRYYFGPRIDVGLTFSYGWIEGDDKNYDEDKDRRKRNLNFRSSIFEVSPRVEVNILPYISNSKKYKLAPYVFGGVGFYHFNPKTDDPSGNEVALQPLGTEGQNIGGPGEKYGLWQFSIPYGLGIKYSLGNFWNLGVEVGQRKLFTDYLDDVSDRYPDFSNGNLSEKARELSWRADEVDPKYSTPRSLGKRGDKNDKDLYVFAGFTLTKTIRRFSCTNF